MQQIECRAEQRPQRQDTAPRVLRTRALSLQHIQPKNPDRSKVKPIHDTRPSTKIIQLLREIKIPRMKHHTKRPTCQPKIPKQQIVLPQRVAGGDVFTDLAYAVF